MAIIKCPECGGKVSSEAKSCPHCGAIINANAKTRVGQPRVASANTAQSNTINDTTDYVYEEESFFEKYKVIIIIAVVIILGVVGYFIYRGQYMKADGTIATDTVDTAAVDTIAVDTIAMEYESDLPTFSELKEFVYREGQMNSDIGLSLLYEYDEPDTCVIPESDTFFGKDAKVLRKTNGEYQIEPKSDHAIVVAFYGSSDLIPYIYFSNKDDYDKFKQQCGEAGATDWIEFIGNKNSEYYNPSNDTASKWYKVRFLQ